ncbi:hypothetical protein NEOLEDRAFT_1246655, partial [Neolentinus lepideus HHB14362 ss-1]
MPTRSGIDYRLASETPASDDDATGRQLDDVTEHVSTGNGLMGHDNGTYLSGNLSTLTPSSGTVVSPNRLTDNIDTHSCYSAGVDNRTDRSRTTADVESARYDRSRAQDSADVESRHSDHSRMQDDADVESVKSHIDDRSRAQTSMDVGSTSGAEEDNPMAQLAKRLDGTLSLVQEVSDLVNEKLDGFERSKHTSQATISTSTPVVDNAKYFSTWFETAGSDTDDRSVRMNFTKAWADMVDNDDLGEIPEGWQGNDAHSATISSPSLDNDVTISRDDFVQELMKGLSPATREIITQRAELLKVIPISSMVTVSETTEQARTVVQEKGARESSSLSYASTTEEGPGPVFRKGKERDPMERPNGMDITNWKPTRTALPIEDDEIKSIQIAADATIARILQERLDKEHLLEKASIQAQSASSDSTKVNTFDLASKQYRLERAELDAEITKLKRKVADLTDNKDKRRKTAEPERASAQVPKDSYLYHVLRNNTPSDSDPSSSSSSSSSKSSSGSSSSDSSADTSSTSGSDSSWSSIGTEPSE